MSFLPGIARALILAPHPDDEVLGCGGTIARIVAEGGQVDVAIVTRGRPPRFDEAQADRVRAEAEQAHRRLGVARSHFLDLPAAELDVIPRADLNHAIGAVVEAVRPDALFVPFLGDVHIDHQLVFEAALVAARPRGGDYPRCVLAYETVSETNWSAPTLSPTFQPNIFVDISDHLETKLAAFALFASQCRPAPDERSLETLRALAVIRGSTVTLPAAEAFMLIRAVG